MKYGIKVNNYGDWYLAPIGFTDNVDKAIEFDSFGEAKNFIENEMNSTAKDFTIIRFLEK